MSTTSEQERDAKTVEAAAADAEAETITEVEATASSATENSRDLEQSWSRRRLLTASLVILIAATAAIGLWAWQRSRNTAGRPVPAPRSITLDQPGDGGGVIPPAAATLTLTPEAVERAGIRTEAVGEQLAPDAGDSYVATGVVQPNAYRETPVVALVGGVVRRVMAELGQNVQRGQTVAVVFSDELPMAQSRYLTAMAELDEHHKHHRRTARLVEIGAASREEFEQAATRLKTAESEVAAGRQRLLFLGLSAQQISALRSTSQISSEVSFPAPVSGTVVSRAVNPGEVVEANKELLRVADLSSVWVIGQVYERDLAHIRVGSGASITSVAYPDRVFRGRVAYVDPRLDPATRTAQVRVELANPGQMLKIGMFVNIAFATIGGSERTLPTVPVAAVQNINNQQIVFVATQDANVFELRPVRLGPEANGRYPVLEGLSVGERVVTEGSFLLRAEWLKSHPGGM